MAKYKFVGDGMGVPGLPHEITDEEAKRLGVKDILAGAIANGNYVEVDHQSTLTPSPSPRGRGEKKVAKE